MIKTTDHETRRNHYVPQVYLKAFADHDSGTLSVLDLSKRKIRENQSPRAVGFSNHLYGDTEFGHLEDICQELETRWATKLRRLESTTASEEVPEHLKFFFAKFIALQHFRVPRTFNTLKRQVCTLVERYEMEGEKVEITKEILECLIRAESSAWTSLSGSRSPTGEQAFRSVTVQEQDWIQSRSKQWYKYDSPEAYVDAVISGVKDICGKREILAHFISATLANEIPCLAHRLMMSEWQLITNETGRPFLTGDHPAYVQIYSFNIDIQNRLAEGQGKPIDPERVPLYWARRLPEGSIFEIAFPATPNLLLKISNHPFNSTVREVTSAEAFAINMNLIRNADREIYGTSANIQMHLELLLF